MILRYCKPLECSGENTFPAFMFQQVHWSNFIDRTSRRPRSCSSYSHLAIIIINGSHSDHHHHQDSERAVLEDGRGETIGMRGPTNLVLTSVNNQSNQSPRAPLNNSNPFVLGSLRKKYQGIPCSCWLSMLSTRCLATIPTLQEWWSFES